MNRVSIEDQLRNAVGFFIFTNRIIRLSIFIFHIPIQKLFSYSKWNYEKYFQNEK